MGLIILEIFVGLTVLFVLFLIITCIVNNNTIKDEGVVTYKKHHIAPPQSAFVGKIMITQPAIERWEICVQVKNSIVFMDISEEKYNSIQKGSSVHITYIREYWTGSIIIKTINN